MLPYVQPESYLPYDTGLNVLPPKLRPNHRHPKQYSDAFQKVKKFPGRDTNKKLRPVTSRPVRHISYRPHYKVRLADKPAPVDRVTKPGIRTASSW